MNRDNTAIRGNFLVIRLTERERDTIEALAKVEKLPASTLARRHLLMQAEQRGIMPRYVETVENALA